MFQYIALSFNNDELKIELSPGTFGADGINDTGPTNLSLIRITREC